LEELDQSGRPRLVSEYYWGTAAYVAQTADGRAWSACNNSGKAGSALLDVVNREYDRRFSAWVLEYAGHDPALWDDLRIARMLRGTRRLQAFLTVRKRPEFLFQRQGDGVPRPSLDILLH
jgi:hypothetical protein